MTAEQTKRFKYWQWRTIIGTMIGYAIFYFVRKNFSFAIPGLTAEYGISKTTFGVIMTLVGLIYGVSKFVNGVLADRTNGRWHMVTGLSVCSVINFIFGCGAIICAWITGQTYGTTFIHTLVVLFGVLLILNMGSVLNVGFEKVFLMQNSLNLSSSEVISTFVYKMGFVSNQYSYSTAIGLFNTLINFVFLVVANAISKRVSDTSIF